MIQVQDKVKGKDKPKLLIKPGRLLLREGTLIQYISINPAASATTNNSNSKSILYKEQPSYVFVFNDMLLVSKQVYSQWIYYIDLIVGYYRYFFSYFPSILLLISHLDASTKECNQPYYELQL